MTEDLKIGYSGGSGGFLLLNLLLLTGNYHVSFQSEGGMENQWNITDHSAWKKLENWPDNPRTAEYQTDLAKIYYVCNPYKPYKDWKDFNAKTCIIYTDIRSQLELASYKRAHWFAERSQFSLNREKIKDWRRFYQRIKLQSWPDCKSFRDIKKLPDYAQKELLGDVNAEKFLKPDEDKKFKKYQEDLVFDMMVPFLEKSDYKLKLQDLVNSNAEILVDLLGIPAINDQQRNLIDQWCSLHPPKLLKRINILPRY